MTLEEMKAHLLERQSYGAFGLSWDAIAKMQRSGKIRQAPQNSRSNARSCVRCGKKVEKRSLLSRCPNCQP
jgi:formamidopyrimidine-DNA glycosylase